MSRPRRQSGGNATGSVRIIGGRLRGSRLPVHLAPGLRPTPDRLRETLFNWIGPWLVGRQVVDLFAGSGALGLEAASRGAASVLLLERDRQLATSLRAQLDRLRLAESGVGADVQLQCADALAYLNQHRPPVDLAFVDPPFNADLWTAAVQALESCALAEDARLYLEFPQDRPPPLPAGWQALKQSRAGDVVGWLLTRG